MSIVTAVTKEHSKTAEGTICVAPQLGWRAWILPKHAAVQAQTLQNNMAYHVTMREKTDSEFTLENDFFTQSGAQRFEIKDEDLRKRFITNLQKTKVEFKVTKNFHKVPSDFFSSETSRANAVAERVAKYYYGSHVDPRVTAKMFCSQFVFQNLQNALVEKSCNGNLTAPAKGESLETWKKTHIDDIKKAVKEFPPELKHVSSSVTPNGLVAILNKLAARSQESEPDKKPASETDNIFSKIVRGFSNFFGGKAPAREEEKVATEAEKPSSPKPEMEAAPSSPTTPLIGAPSPSCKALSVAKLLQEFVKNIWR